MPQGAHEQVEITSLIKGILNGYPGNSAIFREYLQNSDDAKATSQVFVLDERTFPNAKVLDRVLENTQGPALIAVNDGKLRPADWTALKTIHASSKTTDTTQTGKNGLGFRASYHLTDNPHVLSERQLMVLDPHRCFEDHPGGIMIDVITEGPQYPDQLVAFASVAHDLSQSFEGTAFRLPLRTEEQAHKSKIKNSPTSVDEIRELLYDFAVNDLEHVILFLKNISLIEIRHVDSAGREVLVARAAIQKLDPILRQGSVCREVTWDTYNAPQRRRKWLFQYDSIANDEAFRALSKRLGYDVGQALATEKLTANIEVAFPLEGDPIHGALFTLLPLPIRTHFPVHLNAVFTLTPDRQNLKNAQEVGVPGSRERLLVEWNRLIFDSWAPVTWAALISKLPTQFLLSSPWSAWPPEERDESCYWYNLAPNVVMEAVRLKLPLWPTFSTSKVKSKLASLQDPSVLLALSEPGLDLNLLVDLNLDVIQPPPSIFSALNAIPPELSLISSPVLLPENLYKILLEKYQTGPAPPTCNSDTYSKIIDYLVFSASPPTLRRISGLPWFHLASGAAVHLGSLSTKYIIPASKEEAQLFSTHPRMISWDCMSAKLRKNLSETLNFGILNVTVLKVSDVISILRNKCVPPSGGVNKDSIRSSDHAWLLNFWQWIMKWPLRAEFFEQAKKDINDLYILPTSERNLRKLSGKIAVFKDTHNNAVAAWGFHGVYPIHADLAAQAPIYMASIVEVPRSRGYIPLLLRSCNTKPRAGLSEDALVELQESLVAGIPVNTKRSSPMPLVLSEAERLQLSRLRVFRVWPQDGGESGLSACDGRRYLIDVEEGFPLPFIEDSSSVIYVDMKDEATRTLIRLVDPAGSGTLLTEFDVLQLAVDNWSTQPQDLQDRAIAKIFENFGRLPERLRSSLKDLAFVTVNRKSQRVPPRDLIHPTSPIADLYKDEPGKFPTGHFAEKDYLLVMEQAGFVRSTLNQDIVSDRLQYLSKANCNSHVFNKATAFLAVLDHFWMKGYETVIYKKRTEPWLPLSSSLLESPDRCRDTHYHHDETGNTDPHYFDLALCLLPDNIKIYSSGLRKALGWSDPIPCNVLAEQFHHTVAQPTGQDRNRRLMKLIMYLSRLFNNGLSDEIVGDLRAVVEDQSWIPLTASSSTECITIKYAVLDFTRLYPPFRHVSVSELNNSRSFLQAMGCTTRPAFETLSMELHNCKLTSEVGLAAAVEILQEIGTYHHGIDKKLLFIPTIDNQLSAFDTVYYSDMDVAGSSAAPTGKFAANQMISRGLAGMLGMQCLSSLVLGEGDDIESSEQMSEDLVGRIRGFLGEYDVCYALNEFLANADDAHAKEFSIMLNTHPYSAQRVISPEFAKFKGSSTLLLYNDAQLSERDFEGIRSIGRGGKVGQSETHGRHGLGALSLYYFTDVVTVISGDSIMILDPSGSYLPGLRGRKRTAMTRKISEFVRRYPDQLKPFEDLFHFSTESSTYQGTLFILPLQSSITSTPLSSLAIHDLLKTSYRELAEDSFFFTRLEKISASERSKSGKESGSIVWSISADRSATVPLSVDYSMSDVTITYGPGYDNKPKELWVITTSSKTPLPQIHDATATALKLVPQAAISVQLAMNASVTKSASERTSFLFSTLRLPEKASLAFHINARFAISSNRQSVVFDHGGRDPKTAYNTWILDTVVPPLYFSTLEHRFCGTGSHNSNWWVPDPADDITKLALASILQNLPASDNKLFSDKYGNRSSFRDSVFSEEEPPSVTELLHALEVPGFTDSFRNSDVPHLPGARVADGSIVKEILLQPSSLEIIQQLYDQKRLTLTDISTVLDYLRGETPLIGAPLLLLTSGRLMRVPDTTSQPVYHSVLQSHASLFTGAQFLAAGYEDSAIENLLNAHDTNLLVLNAARVLTLTREHLASLDDNTAVNDWNKLFWEAFLTFPGSLPVAELQDLTLIPSTFRPLSVASCVPTQIVYCHDELLLVADDAFWSSLRKLGINVVHEHTLHASVRTHLKDLFPSCFSNILLCLHANDVHNFNELTDEERECFTAWLRTNIGDGTARWRSEKTVLPKSFLHKLPIWECYNQSGRILRQAGDLARNVLPFNFNALVLHAYQKPNTVIAPPSAILINYLEYYSMQRVEGYSEFMTATDIMNTIRLPATIEGDAALRTYKDFLQCMLQLSPDDGGLADVDLLAPDRDGNLRPLDELYNDQIDLFAQTLQYTPRSSFMHQIFRDLVGIQSLALWNNVTPQTFRVCARAVEQALMDHTNTANPNRNALFNMATVAFNDYQRTLPAQIMTNADTWRTLDAISFVRRQDIRRTGASYDVARYCGDDLPLLLPPSRFVQQCLEPVAWTQRALFLSEPDEEVFAVNKSLGVPKAEEVVKHLMILSTEIALDHPGNQTLLSDLKATYKWLDNNSEAAQQPLRTIAKEAKIFLNVSDPSKDSWDNQWVAAKELVLNLQYDHMNYKRVKGFLHGYERLLHAAECQSMSLFEKKAREAKAHSSEFKNVQSLKKTFNDMRKLKELTDIVLVPTNAPENWSDDTTLEDTNLTMSDLRGHRDFLAASIPFVRTGLTGWMTNSNGQIPFYGSAFGAKAILDFVYTGDLELSQKTSDLESMAKLMRDLLELLPIADEWDMPELKKKIEEDIVYKHGMIQALPHEYHTMLKQAKEYNANGLLEALDEFQKLNPIIVRDFAAT